MEDNKTFENCHNAHVIIIDIVLNIVVSSTTPIV